MAAKKVVKIENWKIVEDAGKCLKGKVIGHPDFPDMAEITAAGLVRDGSPTYVETANILYLLGKPAAKKLTLMQGQALAVIKKATMHEIETAPDVLAKGSALYEIASRSADEAAYRILNALIDAKLLVG